MRCRKNSAIKPEEGAPLALPSFLGYYAAVGEIVLSDDNIVPP